ncbi:MAG TPA: CheR family methyltransferase [Chloroflexota bacterium]
MNGSNVSLSSEVRSGYLDLVDRQFGIRESDYGAGRMDEAVGRVLDRTSDGDACSLLQQLQAGDRPDLLDALVEHLTVGETYFLRDPAQMAALRQLVLPEILDRRRLERRVRMWSAGCSTGEEPYTLAILLNEQTVLDDWEVHLFGTDVNSESLRIAREASYPAWSFRATPETFRQRYFVPNATGWRLNDSVRRMVRFAWSNLGADSLTPPSGDFDLIVCRNVTIYFDDAATQRLYRTLVGALSPNGWLMLGPSDPMPADREELERVEVHRAVLWRRKVPGAAWAVRRPTPAAVRPIARSVARVAPVGPRPADKPAVLADAPCGLSGRAELEAGLLALEAGSSASAIEWLRRATFRDPHSPLGQFALARAYLGVGDSPRAYAALLHTQRLLSELRTQTMVPDSDALPVETLRQAVQTHLNAMEGARA